jgi:hypothetical protein
METLEQDTTDRPVINSWRRGPSPEQIRYAKDLCRSELPYAERQATIASLGALDGQAASELISMLAEVRARRLARLRRSRRRPR